MINRREFVNRLSVGLGAALTPSVLGAILSGYQSEARADGYFTPHELEIVGSLADAIIPRTETPGARDVGVPQYIEMILAVFTPTENSETFRSQLRWISAWLSDQNVQTLDDADKDKRTRLLMTLDNQAFGNGTSEGAPAGDPALFAILKPLTVAGYYTSKVGAQQELHQPPYGPYRGDIAFDEIGKTWS